MQPKQRTQGLICIFKGETGSTWPSHALHRFLDTASTTVEYQFKLPPNSWCATVQCGGGVTSWTGQHFHQLVGHPALPHAVNQRLDVPETVNSSKLQQSFSVPLQSDFLKVPVPIKATQKPEEKVSDKLNMPFCSVCGGAKNLRCTIFCLTTKYPVSSRLH